MDRSEVDLANNWISLIRIKSLLKQLDLIISFKNSERSKYKLFERLRKHGMFEWWKHVRTRNPSSSFPIIYVLFAVYVAVGIQIRESHVD